MFLTNIARDRANAPHIDQRERVQLVLLGYSALGATALILAGMTMVAVLIGSPVDRTWAALVMLAAAAGIAALSDAFLYLMSHIAVTAERNNNPGEIIATGDERADQAGVSC